MKDMWELLENDIVIKTYDSRKKAMSALHYYNAIDDIDKCFKIRKK